MPQWQRLGEEEISEKILDQVLTDLAMSISSNPAISDITGMSNDVLAKHAVEAIALFSQGEDLHSVETLTRLYAFGFLIGSQYGRRMESMKGKT